MSKNPAATHSTFSSNVYVQQLVIGVNDSQQHNTEESFVVDLCDSRMVRLDYLYMFPVNGTNAVGQLPFFLELV
jgi:hypothetical protein